MGCSPWGRKESDTTVTDTLTFSLFTSLLRVKNTKAFRYFMWANECQNLYQRGL